MNKSFTRAAWGMTAYTILVILWGAVVRATGSGAGCGNHWPKCNGQIIPRPDSIEVLIEFSHRLTSGLAGLLALGLLVWAWRAYAPGSLVRRWAGVAFFLMLVEGFIGMLLVRLELVQDNASSLRAIAIALHLTNTFLLLAAQALTAWLAGRGEVFRWRGGLAGSLRGLLAVGVLGALLLSAAGAVTALGDTLFPAESLAAGLAQDLDPTANFLIQLRVIHPALAIATVAYLYWLGGRLAGLGAAVARWKTRLYWLMGIQVAAGFINIFLLAPVWMQVIHLLLADLFWLALALLTAETLAEPTA